MEEMGILKDKAGAAITEMNYLGGILSNVITNLEMMMEQAKKGEEAVEPSDRKRYFDAIRIVLEMERAGFFRAFSGSGF